MASFLVSLSSPPIPIFDRTYHLSWPRSIPSLAQLQNTGSGNGSGRLLLFRVKCLSEPNKDVDSESKTSLPSASSTSAGISAYSWCAGLGAIGFLETGYLTYLKLTNSSAFCGIDGGTCDDVLNSDYAVVFGVPLPLIGMVAYGLVAMLGLVLGGKNLPFGISETNGRRILLGTSTSMAVASVYFLYVLSSKFSGTSCSYCLGSVLLSFSLFFITLKNVQPEELQRVVGLQLCIAGLVVTALTASYSTSQPVSPRLAQTELPFFTTAITTESSPFAISLARHLRSIGAKMYGAFWCSHCVEQKQMFGREAAKLLDYVECFPDGYRKGTSIAKACADIKIEGFPTWVINGEVLSGELELTELAKASGFELKEFHQSN